VYVKLNAGEAFVEVIGKEVRINAKDVSYIDFGITDGIQEETVVHLIKEHFNTETLRLFQKHINDRLGPLELI